MPGIGPQQHDILPPMQPQRHILRALIVSAAILYLVFIIRTAFEVKGQTYFTLVDDAMISMRYAHNMALGHGLVWNAGQPPVEGFTNLGWTLIMAFIHLFPFPSASVSLVPMLLGAVILAFNALVVFQIAGKLDPGARFAPLLAATVTAFYFPLVFWTLRGLEVGALTLAISIAIFLSLRITSDPQPRDAFWMTLAMSAALLLRMDAALPVGLILLYIAIRSPHRAILPALFSLLILAAILLFQEYYYGDFLPNTYYLKISGVTAWDRIRTGLLSLNDYASRDFLMPLFLALLGILIYWELRTRESLLLLALFLVQVTYSVWVGGDYAEDLVNSANRFIAQGMPALIILFSLVLERIIRSASNLQLRPVIALFIALGAVSVMSGRPWIQWALVNAPMLRTDLQRARLGLHIREYTDPAAVIAVHAAGQISYFSERPAIDLLGKSDPVIAKGPPATAFAPGHNKWNYEYSILQLHPDVIADNFNKLRGFMEDHPEYELLPNGIYVRVDTTLVNMHGLSSDYR